MGLEVLVLAVCIGDYECGTATQAYFKSRPELQQQAKAWGRKARQQMGNELVVASGVVYAALTDRAYRLRIRGPFSLRISRDQTMLLYSRSF